jgi:hypothetical protein
VGSGFRTFTAGEVLTASNVQNYLMDQSVMSFAGSAARSSAIGTANFEEGMVSYLQDTNLVEVYNGTNWASVAPSGPTPGLVQIGTAISFSAVASQAVNSCFSSTYDFYQIRIRFTSSTANNLTMRFRTGTTDGTTNEYSYALYQMTTNSTVAFTGVSGGTSSLLVAPGEDTQYTSIVMNLSDPISSTINTGYTWQATRSSQSSPYTYNYVGAGLDGQLAGKPSSRDGLNLIASTGTITGTISVFGLAK